MKTFIVEVTDESKTEIDGIVVMEKKEKAAKRKKAEKGKGKKGERLFENTFGMWKNRDIDSRELRKKAWKNRV